MPRSAARIVDLEARAVAFSRSPLGGAYTDISSTVRLGPTALVALPDISVDLSSLFAGW